MRANTIHQILRLLDQETGYEAQCMREWLGDILRLQRSEEKARGDQVKADLDQIKNQLAAIQQQQRAGTIVNRLVKNGSLRTTN